MVLLIENNIQGSALSVTGDRDAKSNEKKSTFFRC